MLSITGSRIRGLLIDVCTILEHRTGCCCFSFEIGAVVGKRRGRWAVAVQGCGCTCRLSIDATDRRYRSKEFSLWIRRVEIWNTDVFFRYPITKLNIIPEWRSFQVV